MVVKNPAPSKESLVNIPLRLGFLASHNGTAMQGIISELNSHNRIKGTASVVISNNSSSRALYYAKEAGIPSYHISESVYSTQGETDQAIRDCLISNGVNIVILSGYMKKVGDLTLNAFPGRILNVHPALLPKCSGIWGDAVHSAVLDSKDQVTGVTIHQIDEKYDHGPILMQSEVPVLANDTVESLRSRVQAEEVRSFIDVLKKIQSGKIQL